ncbi:MAG: F0F1 ATP synthase subunit delta [Pseudomonadota bacterium]
MSNSASLSAGIAGRYATALFELAKDAKDLDTLSKDMDAFSAALGDSPELRDVITSPVYTRDEQGKAISAVAAKMGVSSLVANTLALMASKRRLFALPQLIEGVKALIADHKGEVTAEVTSAKPLTKAQVSALEKQLKTAAGKDVVLSQSVDESLIGGLVVKLGSRMVDTSIRAKLSKLQNAMKEVG